MKIRKTIAFLTALAMIAAMVPAMALTASAASDVTSIILSDGKTAYKVSGSNLIADGSFEGSDWTKQLTVGVVLKGSGVDNIGEMNNPTQAAVGETFARVSGGHEGSYAITATAETLANGKTVINGSDGPASIKHYIKNSGSAAQLYYVRFYAKAASEETAFSWAVEGVNSSDGPQNVATGTASGDWTMFEKVASVNAGEYLIINIYDMAKEAVLLDDFTVYTVYEDEDTANFATAMNSWKFSYYDGQVIDSDMDLPTSVGKATVTWESSHPEIISSTGKFTAPANDTDVTLTATISVGEFSAQKVYTFKTESFLNDLLDAVKATVPITVGGNLSLISTVEGYEGSTVSWKSSNTAVISDTGKYTAPASKVNVDLTATVTYNGVTSSTVITVLAGTINSLIENGGFDIVDGTEIPGWTSGSGSVLSTNNFEYVTDDTGNSYIVSKSHGGKDSAASIKTFIELEPGKAYSLSYKLWYQGDQTCTQLYIGAGLTSDNSTGFTEDNLSNMGYGGNYSGIGKVSKDSGWQIFTQVLEPDTSKKYLCIEGIWLYPTGERDRTFESWAFDDFILQEIDPDNKGTVTVKYVGDDGEDLGEDDGGEQYVGTTFSATSENKADKEKNGYTYTFDTTCKDSLTVEAGENVLTLVFKKLVPADVTVKFLEKETNKELKTEEPVTGYVGFEYEATSAQKATIKSEDGGLYVLDSSSATSVMVKEGSNELVLYFVKTDNLVENGDFSNGTTGWTNRVGTEITGATITEDSVYGNVLTIAETGGKTATTGIGTKWTVEVGKRYALSFDVYYDSMDATYNGVSDATKQSADTDASANSTDLSGTKLTSFGDAGQWNHISVDFVAATDLVYFQASWSNNFKLANVILVEVDESKVGNVIIKYLNKEDDAELQRERKISGVVAGTTYKAEDSDKESIPVGNDVYVYDTTSTDSVSVKENEDNVIKLYFSKVEVTAVEEVTIDTTEEGGVELPETVKVTYSDGTSENVAVTWDEIPALTAGEIVTVKGKAGNREVEANINVFYTADKPDDYDNYNWIGSGTTKYPVAKDATNQIENGGFTDGLTGWTRASDGEEIELEVVDADYTESGKAVAAVSGSGGGGEKTIRTFFPVTAGKTYYVSNIVYNNTGKVTTAQGSTGMSALVASEGKGFGAAKTCGASLYSHVDNGGINSWSSGGSENTDFVIIGTTASRDDGSYAIGKNYIETVINVPETATEPYIMVAYGANASVGLFYGDFQLYELAGEGFDVSKKLVKLTVDVDGEETVSYVEKGYTLPNYGAIYSGATVKIEGSTNEPNVTVTVKTGAPEFKSSVAIIGGNAVVYAVDEDIKGVAVIAQYKDGELIAANATPVDVAAGDNQEVAIVSAEGATALRAMVVESLETMKPLVTSAGATPGSYSPAVINVGDETQIPNVRYNMFDGDRTTYYASQKYQENDNCWFILDFGQEITASEIAIGFNSYETRSANFKLSVSKDGETYTPVYDGLAERVDLFSIALTDDIGSFRYVKYEGFGNDNTSDPKWTSINEIIIK